MVFSDLEEISLSTENPETAKTMSIKKRKKGKFMNIILNGKEITFTTDQYNDLVDHVVKEQKRKKWNLHW